jgi:protein-disulfide isomerase
MENENTTRGGKNYMPLAVVIAGALIAGAIYLNDNGGNTAAVARAFELSALPGIAKSAGLSKTEFNACLEGGKFADIVAQGVVEAGKLGAPGTPFPIIITKSGEKLALPGAMPFETMDSLITEILAGKKVKDIVAALPEDFRQMVVTDLPSLRPLDENDHLQGATDAPVVVLEYSDLQCPYCKRFHDTMNQVMEKYGTEKKVAWAYRHFPILSNHPDAAKVAEASECAAELGGNDAFWKFLDEVFAAQ